MSALKAGNRTKQGQSSRGAGAHWAEGEEPGDSQADEAGRAKTARSRCSPRLTLRSSASSS